MVPLIGSPVLRFCFLACVIIFSVTSFTPAGEMKLQSSGYIITPIKDSTDKNAMEEYEVDSPPECLNLFEVAETIAYPDTARKSGIEGQVIVKLLVDKLGKVSKIGEMSGPEVFYDGIKKKVFNLKFTPGINESMIVKVWVKVTFKFKLEK